MEQLLNNYIAQDFIVYGVCAAMFVGGLIGLIVLRREQERECWETLRLIASLTFGDSDEK